MHVEKLLLNLRPRFIVDGRKGGDFDECLAVRGHPTGHRLDCRLSAGPGANSHPWVAMPNSPEGIETMGVVPSKAASDCTLIATSPSDGCNPAAQAPRASARPWCGHGRNTLPLSSRCERPDPLCARCSAPFGSPVHRVGPDRQEAARDRSISRRTLRPQQFPPARNRTTDWARLRPQGKWI